MPVYHSTLTNEQAPTVCGASILPLKTMIRGPAPSAGADDVDIIDEAINFFRANVLFRSFEVDGGADRVLVYLTVYIGECLRQLSRFTDKASGSKHLFTFSKAEFSIPGEPGFTLGGFFTHPANRAEADTFRAYFRQLREECAQRILERVYDSNGQANKFWMAFSKRQFMNMKAC
ncbi:Actin-related protein 2/3 complex subunit 3 [Plasmodiophora brassicae]